MIKVAHEHPTQGIASSFLRALAEDDATAVFERLSRETRGLLEGLHAARSGIALHAAPSGIALHAAAGPDGLREIVAPLRASALGVLGDPERVGRFGVSGARVVDRHTAYVLLIPDVEREGILGESDWRPAHLLAFVNESGAPLRGSGGPKEWLVDLGRTATLSAEAGLPDPLGALA